MLTDATHAPALRSWVASANLPGCDFPIQNLPLGRFRPPTAEGAETEPPRVGVKELSHDLPTRTLPAHARTERALVEAAAADVDEL